ncbi:uncharacterized protein TrAtP1_007073 [Trichoderma atroviride]|uniref:uncharacterized protein n=1 Tax=Hypocrea atroviridis TaxID=63577 RepID=UPI00331ECE18|nr:hypothetical protein TrAtP1_007073 [Trichoderma atroviride]
MPPAIKRSDSTLSRSPKRHRPETSTPLKQEDVDSPPHNENAQEEEADKVQILHTIRREDAQQLLRCIIEPLREGNMPMASLASLITLPFLMVLPREDKARIVLWAKFKRLKEVTQWEMGISEDVQEHHWYEALSDNPTDGEWKRIEKWLLENPICAIMTDLRQFKEAMQYQADRVFMKDFLLETLMQKLETMSAAQDTANIQLRKDIEMLRGAVNKTCGDTK